jgi:hypothetical protein
MAPLITHRAQGAMLMCIRDHIAVISLVVLSSVTASSGVSYVHDSPIVPRDAMLAKRSGSDTKAQIQPSRIALPSPGSSLRNVGRRADADDTSRERKTLAVIFLMLRDGRGAR